MPSSITAVLNNPYINLWQVSVPINTVGNPLSVSNTIATVGTHPFSTGNIIYTTNRSFHNTNTAIPFFKWYAIRISDTQLAFAATIENAINDVRSTTALTNSDSALGSTGMSIANVPMVFDRINLGIFRTMALSDSDLWVASSKSAQEFQVTDNVQIDLTIPNTIDSSGVTSFVPWYNSFGLIGSNYSCGVITAAYISRGDTISGMSVVTSFTAWTNTYRILIQNRRVLIQNRQTNGSYLTTFTSSELSLNVTNLRLFGNFALNGRALTNCQITYL